MRRVTHAVWVLAFIAGCGARPPGKGTREMPADTVEHLPPAASDFGAAPGSEPAPTDPDAVKLFEAGLAPGYRALMTHAPMLDAIAAAQALAIGESDDEVLNDELTNWLLWRVGETGSKFKTRGHWSAHGKDPAGRADARLTDDARKLSLSKVPYAYGVARREPTFSRYATGLVIVERPVAIDPFPKHAAAGALLTLSGRFAVAVRQPRLYVDRANGSVHSVRLHPDADGRFTVSFHAPKKAGRFFWEIDSHRARRDPNVLSHWRNSLVVLPLYVDVDEPAAPGPEVTDTTPDPPDAGGNAARILAAWNAIRAAAGRPPLALDPALTQLADDRLVEVIAHPEDGPPPDLATRVTAIVGGPSHHWELSNAQGRSGSLSDEMARELRRPSVRREVVRRSYDRAGIHAARNERGKLVLHLILAGPAPRRKDTSPDVR